MQSKSVKVTGKRICTALRDTRKTRPSPNATAAWAYKRACAMAYLGKRAQLHGGVCSTLHPHIMTPQFIADLETSNRTIRYSRYPWLRSLMNLLEEIERIQDQISSTNVISLVPSSK